MLVVTNSGGTGGQQRHGQCHRAGTRSVRCDLQHTGPGTTNVVVQFAPVAVGGFTNNVIFTSANGGVATNTVNGTGLTAGNILSRRPAMTSGHWPRDDGANDICGHQLRRHSGQQRHGQRQRALQILSGATFSVPGFGTTNVVVQFAPVAAGAFTNNLIFASANGGTATNTVSGTGAIVPVASFSASPTNGAVPLAVTFTDTSTGTITNRFWTFGDGATTNTTATSLSHTYASAGT